MEAGGKVHSEGILEIRSEIQSASDSGNAFDPDYESGGQDHDPVSGRLRLYGYLCVRDNDFFHHMDCGGFSMECLSAVDV